MRIYTRKTHCPSGHQYSPDNTYIRANGDRDCRTCARATKRRAYKPVAQPQVDQRPAEIRVWDRVIKPAIGEPHVGCWKWGGYLNTSGYGTISISSRDVLVHRFLYELVIGPIPEGMQIDHLCRHRWCVNPYHMEPVTPRENTMRGISFSAQNARKTHCPQGHPYDETNTIHYGRRRYCRTCRDARNKNAATSREEITA